MDRRKVWVAGAALLLAGCMDNDGPLGNEPEQGPEAPQAALTCQVNVRGGSLSCTPLKPMLPAGASGVVIGGQGSYVLLESSNVNYDAGTEVFSADVTVRNLLTQTLGTADGSSIDANGVRVFFHTMPAVTVGTGVVTVKNADGTSVFTESPAPYFQYDQVLSPGKISLPRNWQWDVPASVETFTFTVYVSAAAAAEESIEAGLRIDARTISAGTIHTCGLTVSGKAYCWGGGSTIPGSVSEPAGVTFTSISAGYWYTCAITSTGTAYCWGRGDQGQLGNGSPNDQSTPTAVNAPPGVSFVSISAGGSHACAITSTGAAYCWGDGSSGQLGNASTNDQFTPTAVDAPAGVSFVSISAGGTHTCAVTSVGAAYCWGYGNSGQLGNGAFNTNSATPVAVAAPDGVTFVSISAGGEHTCATTSAGAAYCWGMGSYGRLGNNSTDHQNTPVAVAAPAGVSFVSISAGYEFTCATSSAGAAYCWGHNLMGQLGIGLVGGALPWPEQVITPAGVSFLSISAGWEFACATASSGTAYCWGTDSQGELGNGTAGRTFTAPWPVSNITNFAWLDDHAPGHTAFAAYALGGRVLSPLSAVCPALAPASSRHA